MDNNKYEVAIWKRCKRCYAVVESKDYGGKVTRYNHSKKQCRTRVENQIRSEQLQEHQDNPTCISFGCFGC